MRCYVIFSHPGNSYSYYFVDLKQTASGLKPVGCFPYIAKRGKATVFETKREALLLCDYLISIGCKARPVKVHP